MLSITGGMWKGHRLKGPRGVRPTAGQVRASLFDVLGASVEGTRWLELCAGSGAVGLEALSRGASHVVFVEHSPSVGRVLRQNLKRVGVSGTRDAETTTAEVWACAAREGVRRARRRALSLDIVFLDPPYPGGLAAKILLEVAENDILAAHGLMIVEHASQDALPQHLGSAFRLVKSRRYGDTTLTTFQTD